MGTRNPTYREIASQTKLWDDEGNCVATINHWFGKTESSKEYEKLVVDKRIGKMSMFRKRVRR